MLVAVFRSGVFPESSPRPITVLDALRDNSDFTALPAKEWLERDHQTDLRDLDWGRNRGRSDCQVDAHQSLHTGGMPGMPAPLRLFSTEAAAKKAGLALADFRGERLSTVLYALLPADEKKPTYLLSSAYRLMVAEKRWVEKHRATVTKLGSFHPGRNFAPLQTSMVRKQKPAEQS
ncbi:hypothetical protein [Deinococcus sp. UYEF24]